MKKFLFFLISLLFLSGAEARKYPAVYAHRGCWLGTEIPENSIAAVEMAHRYGYGVIECDVHLTKDKVMVLMHDFNDMRRCIRRKSDYKKPSKPLALADITFKELRENYVLPSDNPNLRTPVPTLEELLQACQRYGITPLLHSEVEESFHLAQKMMGNNWIAFSANKEMMKRAREISDCMVLVDLGEVTAEKAVEQLREIGGKVGISSMRYNMMTADFIATIRKAGFEVQSSIFPTPHDLEAIQNGATILLSDFCYLPKKGVKPQKKWKEPRFQLQTGERYNTLVYPRTEYGAIVVELNFKGELQLDLNGRIYNIRHDNYQSEVLGLRFSHLAPSLKIEAKTKSDVKKLRTYIYAF